MRHFLIFLFYYLGVDCLFYWLNRKAKRVLTFHHVIPKSILPKEEVSSICFSDEQFKQILGIVGERYGFSNDLSDTTTCTISFDDGYLNQYEVAGKILRERHIPAILFLASNLENTEQPLAVDRHLFWKQQVPLKVAENFFRRSFLR